MNSEPTKAQTIKPRESRPILLAALSLALLFTGTGTSAKDRNKVITDLGPLEKRFRSELEAKGPIDSVARACKLLNQMRNHEAMADLVARIAWDKRPTAILYAASGAHMAPLDIAAWYPCSSKYQFVYTDVNHGVQADIQGFLDLLKESKSIKSLEGGLPITGDSGETTWNFKMGEDPASLKLIVSKDGFSKRGNRLFPADALKGIEMVINHDWSGDQQENLKLIYDFLVTVKDGNVQKIPFFAIENLEAHPYPVDLTFFEKIADTVKPYGQREPIPVPEGIKEKLELGTPLYGGGAVLSFGTPWWRKLDAGTLKGFCDFLLFCEFDNERLNVLSGGENPLIAPPILDWATGFGFRDVLGQDVRLDRGTKAKMLQAAATVYDLLPEVPKRRLSLRMLQYRCLLEIQGAGGDVSPLMPSARFQRRAGSEKDPFQNREMEEKYRDAKSKEENYLKALNREREEAKKLLELVRKDPYLKASLECANRKNKFLKKAEEGKWDEMYKDIKAELAINPLLWKD